MRAHLGGVGLIDYHRFCQIKERHTRQGLNASQIAKELALDPRTVAYWLAQDHFRPRTPRQYSSKLDPFKAQIVRLLERYPYSAAQIFQRLREQGFHGGYSIVKAYVRTVRPRRHPAFLTLAFAPGECAQVDWGSFGAVPIGQTQRRLSFFVMVLCYSRMMYVEFTVSQTMEHFLACHQHAFEFFGGIPHTVMVDNLKSAVLQRALGEAPVFNPKYLDFATHNGFTIAPCNVGKGNEKGRVENAVGYIKKNFLAGLELPDFSVLNPAARQWLDTGANARVHGATKAQPTTLWHQERPSLRPLPLYPFDIATVSQVRASRQFRLTLDTNRYAVPAHYAGQTLTLKTYPDRRCLYHGDTRIAHHARRYDRCQEVEDPHHPKPLLEQRKKARDHQLFRRFLALSPRAEAYYLQREERRLNPHHPVRKIVALRDIDTPEAVARAMDDALTYEACSSESIATLLEQRARFTPEARAWPLTRREDRLESSLAPPDLRLSQATPPSTPPDPEAPTTLADSTQTPPTTSPAGDVEHPLPSVKRAFMAQHSAELATPAAQKMWPHVDSLARRVAGAAHLRHERATQSRIRLARFPVINTLEQCRGDWPPRITRLQVQHHFHLECIKGKATLIFLGGVGRGKTPLATALGSAACLQGYSGLCASAIAVINPLTAAKNAGRLKAERKTYPTPALLILDALGSLPIDKGGAELLCQGISRRYEPSAIVISSHRACKDWPKMFHNDRTLTAAILDRLRHHAETVIIDGKRCRLKDHIEE